MNLIGCCSLKNPSPQLMKAPDNIQVIRSIALGLLIFRVLPAYPYIIRHMQTYIGRGWSETSLPWPLGRFATARNVNSNINLCCKVKVIRVISANRGAPVNRQMKRKMCYIFITLSVCLYLSVCLSAFPHIFLCQPVGDFFRSQLCA